MNKLENDNALIDKLWNECGQSIKRLCEIKLQSDPETAKDVYSEVFLAFTKAIKEGRIITHHKAWLYKVANNMILKKYKELNRNKEIFTGFSDDLIELAVTPDILDSVVSDDDIERIADSIIEELNDDEQELLENYYYEKKTLREIALTVGKTESAVKQQHYRLCKRIKMRIKEEIEKI